jgi:hypothetical protein
MIDPKITQQAIDKLLASPQCMDSVKSVPCDDYQARFGAFIRVKHGNIVINLVDWPTVATTINLSL